MNPEAKRLRIVFDTNVLFSAVAFAKDNPPLKILELVREGRIAAVISPFILEELRRHFFLIKPKLHLSVIERVEADNRILECAVEAGVDVLVTGNMKDIRPLGTFRGIEILTPREFLEKNFPGE